MNNTYSKINIKQFKNYTKNLSFEYLKINDKQYSLTSEIFGNRYRKKSDINRSKMRNLKEKLVKFDLVNREGRQVDKYQKHNDNILGEYKEYRICGNIEKLNNEFNTTLAKNTILDISTKKSLFGSN